MWEVILNQSYLDKMGENEKAKKANLGVKGCVKRKGIKAQIGVKLSIRVVEVKEWFKHKGYPNALVMFLQSSKIVILKWISKQTLFTSNQLANTQLIQRSKHAI